MLQLGRNIICLQVHSMLFPLMPLEDPGKVACITSHMSTDSDPLSLRDLL